MFWLLCACLLLLAVLFLLLPLWRARAAPPPAADTELRRQANVALYRERYGELESELAAGNLDRQQFDALAVELQRKLLSEVDETAATVVDHRGATPMRVLVLPLIIALALPVTSVILYFEWGAIDDVRFMELFQRTVDNDGDAQESRRLILALGEAVQSRRERPWAWYFLAENLAAIGLFGEAQTAYELAAELLPDSPERALILGRVATARYINAGFNMTPTVSEAIDAARAIVPNETASLQLLATDAAERKDYRAAIEYWRLLIQAAPDPEQAAVLRASIAEATELLGQDPSAGEEGAQPGEQAARGPAIEVRVRLADGLELADELRVFIAVRNAAREGMPPLAATALTVADLPVQVRLDDSSAVGPFNLSSAESVYVSVLVSRTGTATPNPGDYRAVSETFRPDARAAPVELVIAGQVP